MTIKAMFECVAAGRERNTMQLLAGLTRFFLIAVVELKEKKK